MKREPMHSTLLPFEGLNNTRDLGGVRTADGSSIKSGMLIRSGQLFFASESDLEQLSRICGTVLDLRTTKERNEKPDPELPGVSNIHLPVFEDMTAGVTREKESDEKAFYEVAASAERSKMYMCRNYEVFVSTEPAIRSYRSFIDLLLSDRQNALLWHCTAGKDRAGFASVLILYILGVPMQDIIDDYLYTNECLHNEIEMLKSMFGGSDPARLNALQVLFSADRIYLESLLSKAETLYGSLDGFITEALRVTPEERSALKEKYLT